MSSIYQISDLNRRSLNRIHKLQHTLSGIIDSSKSIVSKYERLNSRSVILDSLDFGSNSILKTVKRLDFKVE